MRTGLRLSIGALVTALGCLLAASGAMAASIVGSKHDFASNTASAFKGTSDQTCIYCHAAHNAKTADVLWNKNSTTATYTLYSSNTMEHAATQPAGVSKLCLSCHDGSIAADSFGTTAGTKFLTSANSSYFGTDLSNDHPISMAYPTADTAIVPAATVKAAGLPLYGAGNTVECGSCHNTHDPAIPKFLRKANASSALCTTCHIK